MERIAAEAVANAVRHSGCSRIEIVVKSSRDGVALRVRDDGCGFDYDSMRRSAHGLGLLMMEYCAGKAGLELTVSGSEDRGATVTAFLPKNSESQ